MTHSPVGYRPDIDGLRAIAVISVLIYHAFPKVLPSGFIGVDIFFVISGFLITSIIQREIENSSFSIKTFYERRIKRIFPALIVVLLATFLVGWVVLLKHEFQQLGWHGIAGVGFFSNIALWAEAGYFDVKSEAKPLLHLWSLGVEEQFYILWPLLLVVIYRTKINLHLTIALLLTISFVAGYIVLDFDPSSGFYLPFYRFWELMIGGLLATALPYLNRPNHSQYLSVGFTNLLAKSSNLGAFFGLTLIVIALIFVDKNKQFPGFWALLPTLGTALLIVTGQSTYIGKFVLSNRLMVGIGLISYPLYLWHWPIFTFARIVDLDEVSDLNMFLLLLLSVLLACMTYFLIEKPLRSLAKQTNGTKLVLTLLMSTMILVFILGLLITSGVLKERLSNVSNVLSEAAADFHYPGDNAAYIPGRKEKAILFFGDSFTYQLWPRVEFVASKANGDHPTIIFNTRGGCAPIEGLGMRGKPACLAYTNKGHELAISADVETIVISTSWWGMRGRENTYDSLDANERLLNLRQDDDLQMVMDRFEKNVAKWKHAGKAVYIILQPPTDLIAHPVYFSGRLKLNPRLERKQISKEIHLKKSEKFNKILRGIAKRNNVRTFNAASLFCDKDVCNFSDENGIPYFADDTHMRNAFVREHYLFLDHLILNQ